MEKEKLIAELDERYLKKEGGKDMPDNEKFVSHKDLEIMELEKAKTNLENIAAEQRKLLDDPVIARYLKHEQTCQAGGDCFYRVEPQQLYEAGQKEGYNKGKADTKANLSVDDISAKLVGEWIRAAREREREGK